MHHWVLRILAGHDRCRSRTPLYQRVAFGCRLGNRGPCRSHNIATLFRFMVPINGNKLSLTMLPDGRVPPSRGTVGYLHFPKDLPIGARKTAARPLERDGIYSS